MACPLLWATIITVIEFGVNDGGGIGVSYGGIKVKTDSTKLSNMVVANFGVRIIIGLE